jgi:hypothetical protein
MKLLKWSAPVLALGMMIGISGARAAEEASQSQAKVKLSGVVLLEDGKPAASATVRVMEPTASKKDAAAEKTGDVEKPKAQAADDAKEGAKSAEGEKPKRAEALETTTTNEKGEFSFNLAPGKYTIAANIKGVGMTRKTVTLKAGKDMENVELKLKPSAKKAPAEKAPAAPATPAQ